MSDSYGHDFLDAYLQLVEETESPRIFHIWSALSGISAVMGRRCFLPFGDDDIFPNLYVLLVGNSASRKSTAMKIMAKLVRRMTGVKFGPDDSGGKRQGIVAMMADAIEDEEELENIDAQLKQLVELTPESLGRVVLATNAENKPLMHTEDKYFLYVAASEFVTFIGEGNSEFLRFLGKMYDGEEYKYKLKQDELYIPNPLISMIGCTTPTDINTAVPHAAIGQGFMSRVILVYGSKKHKSVPRPERFDPKLKEYVEARIKDIYFGLSGEMKESKEAYDYINWVYENYKVDLHDGRFTYYLGRRHTHLLKLGMVVAAARCSNIIQKSDYELANALLSATEINMPDALGEYGMSPIAAAKQKIVDAINAANEPISLNALHGFMRTDLKMHELANVLQELVQAEKIQQSVSKFTGQQVYLPYAKQNEAKLELMDLITNAPTTEITQ